MFWPRENWGNFFFFFCARPILARQKKEFAPRPLETLAVQAISTSTLLLFSTFVSLPRFVFVVLLKPSLIFLFFTFRLSWLLYIRRLLIIILHLIFTMARASIPFNNLIVKVQVNYNFRKS